MNVFEVSPSDWNQFVDAHPNGSVFHLLETQRVFNATPGYNTMYIGARDNRGKLVALLAAVKIDTLGGLLSKCTSRSIMFAEPICEDSPAGLAGLSDLIATHDEVFGRRVLFTEVRPVHPVGFEHQAFSNASYRHQGYLNYVNDLSDGPHVLRPIIKKVLQKVRKAERHGVRVERHPLPTPEFIDRAFAQIQKSYKRAKVPLADRALFHAAAQHLPEGMLQVRIATLDGEDIASAFGLAYKDRYFAWFNGTSRPKGISSTACLVWDEMQFCFETGLRFYDFGGAGWPDKEFGPRTFKSRFGGRLLNVGRYRRINSRFRMALASTSYQCLRGILTSGYGNPEAGRKREEQSNV